MAKNKKTPDAPESSAGDDFHVLWAIQKSLELFNFKDDGLKAVTIEGSASEDAKRVDPDGDLLLGVDIGEYFGGENFTEAKLLVFTQLKYSTRHPNIPWTIARICQGKKSKYSGSIIHRLATICKTFLEKHGETLVKEKLRLKLVSNRPASNEIIELVNAVKRALDVSGKLPAFNDLIAAIDTTYHDGLKKIKAACGLETKDISLFISLLDFSDCGTSARLILKEETIRAINKVSSISPVDTYDALHVKIWHKMMPENREYNKLTIIDMLKTFNVGTVNQLFPVPAHFEPHDNLIRRVQLEEIVQSIVAATMPICLHAGAGMGKSSVIQQLESELPEGSVVITFDCYGGGSYLDPDDARHKPEWALKQVANQMSLNIGSDFFLLQAGQPWEIYYRDFKVRLEAAAKILQEINPDALLVLVIDAADNSVTAAKQKGERSFVLDMVRLSLPEGCRLAVTTRSHRLPMLQLPDYVSIELLPFKKEETMARLKPIFPDISEEFSLVFHRLTHGIPRVQTYALVNSKDGIEAILAPLKPSGKELDDLMHATIEFVKKKLGEPEKIDCVFQYVISLPRPISLVALADLAENNTNVVLDIVTDIGQGIDLNNNTLSLTDEDFEDYLDRTYPANNNIHQKIADYFLSKAMSDAYASRHLGNMLRLAGRYDTLKEIVLSGQYLSVPPDPVVLKEMLIERTRAAMALSIAENNPVDFLKLQVVAAEAAKTDNLLEQTLLNNADLNALFGDPQTIEKLIQTDPLTWYAPVYYRCAAVYARNKGTLAKAKEHFKVARSWMEWRDRQEAFQEYRMSPEDFVFAAEATCRLMDVKSALDLLYSYNCDSIGSLSQHFLQHMLIEGSETDVDQAIKNFKWSLRVKLNITKSYFKCGRQSAIEIDAIVAELSAKFSGRKFLQKKGRATILEISEYLSWQHFDPTTIQQLLSNITRKNPGRFLRFYASTLGHNKELSELDLSFKTRCLTAAWTGETVMIADFYNEKIKSVDMKGYHRDDSTTEERQRADILFGSVLPLFVARAKYLTGKLDEASLLKVFETFKDTLERNYELYRYRHEMPHFQMHYAEVFSDLGLYVKDKATFCKALVEVFTSNNNGIAVKLIIASTLSRLLSGHPVALSLLNEAAEMIFNAETDAGAKIDDFLQCVRIGARLDDSVGKAYFNKMIDTVGEMDLEGFDQVRFIGELAKSFEGRYPKAAFDYARFTQFAYSRLHGWDHFPWRESIAGIGALDHFGVWATLARWDHTNLIDANDYLLTACESALRKGLLPPATHANFMMIATPYHDDFSSQLISLISKAEPLGQQALSAIGHTFYRIIRFECAHYYITGLLTELKNALKKAGCKDTYLITLIANFGLIDENPKENAKKSIRGFTQSSEIAIPAIDWSDIIGIQTLVKEWGTINQRSSLDFLITIRSECGIGQYFNFLNFVTELDDETLSYYDLERLLEETFVLWSDHPALPEWKTRHFLPFLQRVFEPYIVERDIMNTPSISRIAILFDATEQQLAEGIKQLLAKNVEQLTAGTIYQLGTFTKTGLTEEQLLDVVKWVLQRWMSKIPNTWPAAKWDEKFRVPNDSQQAAAGLLRYFLGHPQKEKRWRALHGLRLASRMGDITLLSFLLANQDEKQAMPFQHEPYTFYWMSAKLWLWMLMKKLGEEHIPDVAVFGDIALLTIEDQLLPHLLIRYHAQQFCLSVEKGFPGTFTTIQLKKISTALLQPVGQNDTKVEKDSLLPMNQLKFHFDTMDTIPYWYDPLGDVFGVSALYIANQADHVITYNWGYSGKPHEDDHVRVDDSSYYSTANGHGDIPSIEKLRLYYEFHAMFCVASQLIAKPSSKDKVIASLKEWLEGWNTTFDCLWLSDLRDTTPPDSVFNSPNRLSDWRERIIDEYIANYLQSKENWITVDANIKLMYGSDYESVSINSALVNKEKGTSLLYALQEMPLHNYKLPEEGEDYHEIDYDGFTLKGWYYNISGRDEVHDRLDPLANKLQNNYLRPGKLFMNWARCKLSNDFRKVTNSKNEIVSCFENWDDSSEYPDSHQVETKGQRLTINTKYLKGFLKKHRYSLLVEIKVDREEERRSYRNEDERTDIEQKNIYLIEEDGTIKTVAGDFKLR